MYKKIVLFLVLMVLSLSLSCSLHGTKSTKEQAQKEETSFAGLAMGGIVHIKMIGAEKKAAEVASDRAFSTMNLLAEDFDHRTGGSIAKVNRAAGEKPVAVSKDAFVLIKRALHLGELSSGVFDITIGAITTEPFYYQKKEGTDKKDLVNYKKVVLQPESRTVFLPQKGMALDLGGIAKGSIVDAAAEKIRQAGVPAALVEASGDFFCYGEHLWKVGVQDPRSKDLLGVIEVQNAGVCGSGDYYQYETSEKGERKHHILDASKLTSAHKSIAVTVIAPSAELADALATTLFIMGPAKGLVFLKNFTNCSALWVLPDRQLVASDGFPPFLKTIM